MKEISLYHLPMGWETATIDNLIGVNGLFVDGDWIESKDQNPNGGIRLRKYSAELRFFLEGRLFPDNLLPEEDLFSPHSEPH